MKVNRCVATVVCLPEGPIDRIVEPVARFLHVESASGVVLLGFTAAALALANSSF